MIVLFLKLLRSLRVAIAVKLRPLMTLHYPQSRNRRFARSLTLALYPFFSLSAVTFAQANNSSWGSWTGRALCRRLCFAFEQPDKRT
jgi:hypothetical protein